jgi:chromosome segregation ATPase
MREDHAVLRSNLNSVNTKFERTSLRLEDAQSVRAEADRKLDEAQKSNASLRLQLEKWQKLEKKDDEELEEMRTKRLELEAYVQKLEARVNELERDPPKDTDALESRVKKLTTALEK